MIAYILLPPAGGVLLLLLEHKSDYVRLVSSFEVCVKSFHLILSIGFMHGNLLSSSQSSS